MRLLPWLVYVIWGFIKNFLPNSYFILQIHRAKSFKMRFVTSLYLNFSVWYLKNALKIQYYYSDLIELQNAPLTYSLWENPSVPHGKLIRQHSNEFPRTYYSSGNAENKRILANCSLSFSTPPFSPTFLFTVWPWPN